MESTEIKDNSGRNTTPLLSYCFPVSFAKFLRTPFLQNTSGQLLLQHAINSLSLALIPYSTVLRRELCVKIKHVSKHQGFQNKLSVDNKIYFNVQGNL